MKAKMIGFAILVLVILAGEGTLSIRTASQ